MSKKVEDIKNYMEGYEDEEGNHIPGEIEKAEQEGRQINFKGNVSKADKEAQEAYTQEYDEYENLKNYQNQRMNLMQYELNKKQFGGLNEFAGGGQPCPEGFQEDPVTGECVSPMGQTERVQRIEEVPTNQYSKYIAAYEEANPRDAYVYQKKADYLKKYKGLNRQAGLSQDNFNTDVEGNFNSNWEYNRNSEVIKQFAKDNGINPKNHVELVEKLADKGAVSYDMIANSKYGSKLQPSLWARSLAGAQELGNFIVKQLPGEQGDVLNIQTPGLTKKEWKDIHDSNFGGLQTFSAIDIPGAVIGNSIADLSTASGGNYQESPGILSGELKSNMDPLKATLLNPFNYSALVKGLFGAQQGIQNLGKLLAKEKSLPASPNSFELFDLNNVRKPSGIPGSPNNVDNVQKAGFLNPLALLDRITPRLPAITKVLGMEDDVINHSPFNLIPGYGKKLAEPGFTHPINSGNTAITAYRKFGNSLDDVINSKTFKPEGGFRMGAKQIQTEGNWAESGIANENYKGVFAAGMDPRVAETNIQLQRWSKRNGVVGRTKQGNPAIPVTDPGLQFHRRLPFSNKYVPINKQKLIDNKFQLATQLPHVQSLIEKYGIAAAYALISGYLVNGKEGAVENLKTVNKYTVDPVINWSKKAWGDLENKLNQKQYGGLHRFTDGGPTNCGEGYIWNEELQQCVENTSKYNQKSYDKHLAEKKIYEDALKEIEAGTAEYAILEEAYNAKVKKLEKEKARVLKVRGNVIPVSQNLDLADNKINPRDPLYQNFLNASNPKELELARKALPQEIKNVLPNQGSYNVAKWNSKNNKWNEELHPGRELYCTPYGCFAYQKAGASDVPIIGGNIDFANRAATGNFAFEKINPNERQPGDMALMVEMAPNDYSDGNSGMSRRPHHTTIYAEPDPRSPKDTKAGNFYNAYDGLRLNFKKSFLATKRKPGDRFDYYRYVGAQNKINNEVLDLAKQKEEFNTKQEQRKNNAALPSIPTLKPNLITQNNTATLQYPKKEEALKTKRKLFKNKSFEYGGLHRFTDGGPIKGSQGLNADFSTNLTAFINAAKADGIDLGIGSGFRSVEKQKQLWEQALKKYGTPEKARKWVAPPGKSNHNRGTAVDLNSSGAFLGKNKNTKATQWAHANAEKYGLNFRMGHEPWHIEPLNLSKEQKAKIDAEHQHSDSEDPNTHVDPNNVEALSKEGIDMTKYYKNLGKEPEITDIDNDYSDWNPQEEVVVDPRIAQLNAYSKLMSPSIQNVNDMYAATKINQQQQQKQFAKGGYIDAELTDKEITNYKNGGYVVEYLD